MASAQDVEALKTYARKLIVDLQTLLNHLEHEHAAEFLNKSKKTLDAFQKDLKLVFAESKRLERDLENEKDKQRAVIKGMYAELEPQFPKLDFEPETGMIFTKGGIMGFGMHMIGGVIANGDGTVTVSNSPNPKFKNPILMKALIAAVQKKGFRIKALRNN